jgi:hypothetical protein
MKCSRILIISDNLDSSEVNTLDPSSVVGAEVVVVTELQTNSENLIVNEISTPTTSEEV